MNVTNIPFIKLTGIEQDGYNLSLDYKDNVLNHVKTIHASAHFSP